MSAGRDLPPYARGTRRDLNLAAKLRPASGGGLNFDRSRRERRSLRAVRPMRGPGFLAIDDHGNSGDGCRGRIGTCDECGRSGKVVAPVGGVVRCLIPERASFLPSEMPDGCEAQRGPRPSRRSR